MNGGLVQAVCMTRCFFLCRRSIGEQAPFGLGEQDPFLEAKRHGGRVRQRVPALCAASCLHR